MQKYYYCKTSTFFESMSCKKRILIIICVYLLQNSDANWQYFLLIIKKKKSFFIIKKDFCPGFFCLQKPKNHYHLKKELASDKPGLEPWKTSTKLKLEIGSTFSLTLDPIFLSISWRLAFWSCTITIVCCLLWDRCLNHMSWNLCIGNKIIFSASSQLISPKKNFFLVHIFHRGVMAVDFLWVEPAT